MTHGTADDFITPHNSEAYYQRQVKQFGQAGVDSFMRFYMIPGFGHGFGPFNAKIDSLTVLRDWVEKGQAPKGLTASTATPTPTARGRSASGRSGRSSRAPPAPRTAPPASPASRRRPTLNVGAGLSRPWAA